MRNFLRLAATAAISLAIPAISFAQNTYDVNRASTPPTIDGVVSPGEWADAAAAAGGWRILRNPSGPTDIHNNRFQMMWDDTYLYLLTETDYGVYRSDNIRDQIRFGYNNLNLYFDPDLDGEGNQGTETAPFLMPDGYQIALNQYEGSFICPSAALPGPCSVEHNTNEFDALNRGPVGISTFAGAYADDITGNNLGWLGMRGTMIGTVNGSSGGVVEMAIPWSDFDAPGLDANGEDPGLNLNGTIPAAGDQWNFNIGQIINDTSNPLPVWNWHDNPDGQEFFASHPHGEITFVGDAVLLGDVNMDGIVDFLDIQPFIDLLAGQMFQAEADINSDGSVNFFDIQPFIDILAQ